MGLTQPPLKTYRDAAGQTWYDVPGYGQVNWPLEQITTHARYVWSLHRPDQPLIRVRIQWGVLPLVVWPHRHCKLCQTSWLCREAQWAGSWLAAPVRETSPSASGR